MNEQAPGKLRAESTFDDGSYRSISGPRSETLTIESLDGLYARVRALAARVDELEPEIKEIRRRAGTLTINSSNGSATLLPVAGEPRGRPFPIAIDQAPSRGAEESPPAPADRKSKMGRNLVSLLMSQAATMIVTLISLIVLPKYLGTNTFGALSFAGTFVGLFLAVSLLGSNQFLVKSIAREPTKMGTYVFNALAMKFVLSSLLAAIAIAIAYVAGYPRQTTLIIAISCLGMIFATLNDVLTGALQGIEQMGTMALWATVQQYAAGVVSIGVVLFAHTGVIAYVLVITAAALIPLLANGYHLWPEIRGRVKLDLALWRAIAIGGVPFFLWGALLLVYGSIDILMLQGMTNSDVVGWYSLAYRWVGIPVALPTILATVVLPSLSTLAHANAQEFSRIVNRALQIALFAAIPMAIGIALVAKDLIQLLHYPAGFEHSVILMQILAIHIPVVAMDMILATALAAKDRQKAWLVIGCVAVVFNPTLNLIAIPWTTHRFGNGAIGASIVTVATEVLMMVGAIYLRPTGVLDRATIFFVARCLVAALIMVPALDILAGLPLGVKIFVGIVTFACGAWALRLVSLRPAWNTLVRPSRLFSDRSQAASVPSPAD